MPENEKEDLSASTDVSLPKEQWEQKLLENEKTAFLTTDSDKKEETPQDPKPAKRFSGRGVWSFLLLACFAVSAVCGVYLTVRPVPVSHAVKGAKPSAEEVLGASLTARNKKGNVAWIKVRGVIAQDNSTSPFSRPKGASEIAKKIREAGKDETVKAIVLDINSPGGTVASVQDIYSEILRAKENKKVVALFRDVAASGGVLTSMAGGEN